MAESIQQSSRKCNIELIKEIQEAFNSQGFNVFCTCDEDEGLHVAIAEECLGSTHEDEFEQVNQLMLEYLEKGHYSMVKIGIYYFALTDKQKELLTAGFLRYSAKRETFYLDWEYMFDNK